MKARDMRNIMGNLCSEFTLHIEIVPARRGLKLKANSHSQFFSTYFVVYQKYDMNISLKKKNSSVQELETVKENTMYFDDH